MSLRTSGRCISDCKLDPANYYTSPGLAWDAMLLQTQVELEHIHDEEALDIMERHKRGGLCFVGSKRHAEANNKHVVAHYVEDDSNPTTYIVYWDCNTLNAAPLIKDSTQKALSAVHY